MLKLKLFVCATALSTFLGLPVLAQDDASGDNSQVMDEELPPADATATAADAAEGTSGTAPKCVPRPTPAVGETAKPESISGDGDLLDDKAEDAEAETKDEETTRAATDENGESTDGPEMSDVLDEDGNPLPYCEEKPYIPVEPPPVISDEINFSQFGDNPNSAAVKAAQADYMAVKQALNIPLETYYKSYQVEMHQRRKSISEYSFAQYMYDDYRKSRTGGILFIGIGGTLFGGLTAVGAVTLNKGLTDDCLPANDANEECDAPERGNAEDIRDRGIILLVIGAVGTVTSVVIGAVKIKRASGPMDALEPLVAKPVKSEKKSFHINGFAPIVATADNAAPGATLLLSF